MNDLEHQLRHIATELRALDRKFALIGGLAVSIRAEPRLTRDADLAVAVTDDRDAESLIHVLSQRGYSVVTVVEQRATGRLATVRLINGSSGGAVTDLLFASSGIESEIIGDAEELSVLPNLTLPVASTGHLIAMKLLARDDRQRPLDADDLRALSAIASTHDWEVAASAAELISARGYGRDRDIVAALAHLRDHGAY